MALEKSVEESNEEQNKEQSPAQETEKSASGERMISESEVEKMIAKQMAQYQSAGMDSKLAEAINNLNVSIAGQQKPYDKFKYIGTEDIALEDLLKEPVTFWATGTCHVVGDDRRGNVPIPAPYGPILFTYDSSKKNHGGKEANILHVCKRTCQSKKELEFLRKHTEYSIRFHERMKDTEMIDARLAVQMSKKHTALKNMASREVIEMLTRRGLGYTDDVEQARIILAKIIAEEEIEMMDRNQKIILQENRKDELLLGSDNKNAKSRSKSLL